VGTGTIGEPLIGLFTDFREKMGIDEVTFQKRTPPGLGPLEAQASHGPRRPPAVDDEVRSEFEKLGHEVSLESREPWRAPPWSSTAPRRATKNKEKFYENITGPKGFLAQGSEFGFGKPFAKGVNDEVLVPGEDRFIQIVSCNTHNVTTLIKTICNDGDGKPYCLERGRFVCMRRSNDISQADSFVPAPNVGKHDDPTSHPPRARRPSPFRDPGDGLNLFSSAVKLNTQYMHSIWFNLDCSRDITTEEVKERLKANPLVAVTDKRYANLIFSFGRDHGYYGRILSQTVVVLPTVAVRRKREVYGFLLHAAGRQLAPRPRSPPPSG